MVKLSKGGAYLINGTEIIEDSQTALAQVAAKTGSNITSEEAAKDYEGLNIVQNNGEAAGQTVFHFHMHIIPRYKNDTVNVGWKPGEAKEDVINAIKNKVTPYL